MLFKNVIVSQLLLCYTVSWAFFANRCPYLYLFVCFVFCLSLVLMVITCTLWLGVFNCSIFFGKFIKVVWSSLVFEFFVFFQLSLKFQISGESFWCFWTFCVYKDVENCLCFWNGCLFLYHLYPKSLRLLYLSDSLHLGFTTWGGSVVCPQSPTPTAIAQSLICVISVCLFMCVCSVFLNSLVPACCTWSASL